MSRSLGVLLGLAFALAGCTGDSAGGNATCASNRDCEGAGAVCISGSCVQAGPTPECTEDTECGLGEYCDPASRQCAVKGVTGCTDDTQCAADQRCNTLTNVCQDLPRSCGEGGSCPTGRHCDTLTNACVQCLTVDHCGAEQLCEDNVCVDEDKPTMPGGCTDDSQCNPPLTICENEMCSLGCGQPGGMACEEGAVCDTSNGRCVTIEGPCMMDSDCTPPQTVCESGQCIPGCGEVGGVQCPGGQQCNPNSGRCQAGGVICISDDDCNAPMTICNLFSGVCDPGCGTAGCTAPQTCNASTGHCTSNTTCMADRFEPNDSASAPAQINGGALSGLTLCPGGDQDYFAVSLGQGDSVDVTLSFVHGEGNLDLELLSPSGQVVAQSAGTSGTEMMSYAATTPGVYVVHVLLVNDTGPNPGNTYTLDVRANVAPCAVDPDEENDSDGDAKLILPGSRPGRNVCLGDEDFYDVILQEGDTLTVDLTFSHAEGDIDMQVLGFLGIPVASGSSSNDNESVSYTATRFGFFTIRVALGTDTGSVLGNPYDMNVSVGQAPAPMCSADALEENDSASAARPLSPGTQSNLNVCSGDDDFYSFNFAQGDDVTVNVAFSDAEGDIDLQLLNAGGTEVAISDTNTDDESISYTVATAGPYLVRVYLYGDAGSVPGNPYSLSVQAAGSLTCAADPFEANNTSATATALPQGTYSNLTACENDDDYYALSLTSGQAITVLSSFSNAEGDIDLRLFDPGGTQVASALTVTDDETFTYTPAVTGTHVLQVNLYGDAGSVPGNSYQLTVGP